MTACAERVGMARGGRVDVNTAPGTSGPASVAGVTAWPAAKVAMVFTLLCAMAPCAAFGQTGKGAQKRPVAISPHATAQKAPPNLSAHEVFERYRSGVVTVRTGTSLGTGFLYGTGVLTCFHVIDGAGAVTVEPLSAKPCTCKSVWACSKDADAAYLSLDDSVGPPLSVAMHPDLRIGDPLYVIGNPQGLEQSLTEGILSARRTSGDVELLQLSAAVSPGSSGSPVFDRHGDVVGIVVGSLKEGQQLNFAISMASVLAHLRGVPLPFLFRGDVGLSLANPDVLKLLSVAQSPLMKVADLAVDVADLPGTLDGVITKDDVRRWAVGELAHSAPALRVVSREEQKKRFDASAPAELAGQLGRVDDLARAITLNVGYGTDKQAKVSWYSVRLDFGRVGLVPGGLAAVNVWGNGYYGAFGESATAEDTLRDVVQKLVAQFAEDWVRANK